MISIYLQGPHSKLSAGEGVGVEIPGNGFVLSRTNFLPRSRLDSHRVEISLWILTIRGDISAFSVRSRRILGKHFAPLDTNVQRLKRVLTVQGLTKHLEHTRPIDSLSNPALIKQYQYYSH